MRPSKIALPQGAIDTAWWGPGPNDAATIVLLHEGLGSVGLWRDFPQKLSEATGCGVFAFSRHGYGQSAPAALPRHPRPRPPLPRLRPPPPASRQSLAPSPPGC